MCILTQRLTINPFVEQQQVLWELSETCRLLYNHALAERKLFYESYQLSLSYSDQQNCLPALKKKFPRYQQVYSKVLQMTLRKLDGAFKAFFGRRKNGDTTANLPTFRGKNYFFTLCYNQSGYKITTNAITFSHYHPSKEPLVFTVPLDFTLKKVKQIEIFQDRYDKKFYLAIAYEQEELPYVDNGHYQVFDLGTVKHTAVNSQGKFLESIVKRPDKFWEKNFRLLQQRKSRCKKGSRRYRHLQQRLATIKRKCANQSKDWQHKQSINLLKNTQANTIIIGALSPKKMTRTNKMFRKKIEHYSYQRSVNRGINNTGHLGLFVEFLTYKATLMGKRVIEIDETDTTKTCSFCGHKKKVLHLSERIFHCEVCKVILDRDRNSAVNIMKRFLSQNALWTSYQQFLDFLEINDNLRHTANCKTKVPYYCCCSPFKNSVIGSEDS
ncbi:MAG: RNA-guided endonuclease InsQ/TnpB family protein [Candidatus Hodarchaeota archaeon]